MLAATNSHALWYLTRATGLVSLLLLTGTVVLGIIGVQRWSSRHWPRFVTAGLQEPLPTRPDLLDGPCRDRCHRQLRHDHLAERVRALHRHLPAGVARSRRGRRRPAGRLDHYQPGPAIHRLPGLAGRALGRLRVLADRLGPRDWDGHRCPPWLGAGMLLGSLAAVCAATWWRVNSGRQGADEGHDSGVGGQRRIEASAQPSGPHDRSVVNRATVNTLELRVATPPQ